MNSEIDELTKEEERLTDEMAEQVRALEKRGDLAWLIAFLLKEVLRSRCYVGRHFETHSDPSPYLGGADKEYRQHLVDQLGWKIKDLKNRLGREM